MLDSLKGLSPWHIEGVLTSLSICATESRWPLLMRTAAGLNSHPPWGLTFSFYLQWTDTAAQQVKLSPTMPASHTMWEIQIESLTPGFRLTQPQPLWGMNQQVESLTSVSLSVILT